MNTDMTVDKALVILKEAGYKLTDKRESILAFFEKEDRYRTAKHLLDYMATHYEGISFDTIYRNLNLFSELGILESTELDGENHYQISCADHHHHHFICRECGVTEEVETCPMDEIAKKLKNFIIEDHKFEIYGLCPVCH